MRPTPITSDNDINVTANLVRKAQKGDVGALSDLCARYMGRIHRMARARLGPLLRRRLDSLDIAQETILKVIASLREFECRNEASFLNWVSRLVENTIRDQADYTKAAKRDVRKEDSIAAYTGEDGSFGLPALSVDITRQLEVRNDVRHLEAALDRLNTTDREVILLRDGAGMTFPEIGLELEMSPDAARMRYARAAERLAGLIANPSEDGT